MKCRTTSAPSYTYGRLLDKSDWLATALCPVLTNQAIYESHHLIPALANLHSDLPARTLRGVPRNPITLSPPQTRGVEIVSDSMNSSTPQRLTQVGNGATEERDLHIHVACNHLLVRIAQTVKLEARSNCPDSSPHPHSVQRNDHMNS